MTEVLIEQPGDTRVAPSMPRPTLSRRLTPATRQERDDRRVALHVEHLSAWYGSKLAVSDLSMDFYANSITALIGPSGCGKSTFLRCLNRMHEVIPGARVRGQVQLEGDDIYAPSADPTRIRQRIGMVFQKPNPFPKSIYDNVAFGPKVNDFGGDMDRLVEDSLRRAALWDEVSDRLGDSAFALSGGQQQRLCIARALAVKPEIVLMDEPASALDPIATQRIEELIYELKREYTIVIVTHNMRQAARVSDYTAFLYMGEMIEYGPTETIFTNPREARTEAYVTGRFG